MGLLDKSKKMNFLPRLGKIIFRFLGKSKFRLIGKCQSSCLMLPGTPVSCFLNGKCELGYSPRFQLYNRDFNI
jgi:hypothetical protein